MATIFLFLLLILTIVFLIMNYKKASLITSVLMLIFFILIGNGFLSWFILKWIESPISELPLQWKNRNAIVMLGAGTVKNQTTKAVQPLMLAHSRIAETARVYLSCIKTKAQCTVIISGGDAMHNGVAEAVAYQEALYSLGVDSKDVKLESKSMNTYQNAELTSRLLKDEKFEQVFLVTSSIHLKRALLYFSHFDIHAIPVASDYIAPYFSLLPIGYNFAITDFAIHEYLGLMRYYLKNSTTA